MSLILKYVYRFVKIKLILFGRLQIFNKNLNKKNIHTTLKIQLQIFITHKITFHIRTFSTNLLMFRLDTSKIKTKIQLGTNITSQKKTKQE